MGYGFDFEKLNVYKKAIDFTNSVFESTKRFSKETQFSLGDRFRRASLSICNNIAEGSGKNSIAAKRQYYSIALDSARECIPLITISTNQRQLTQQEGNRLREVCVEICRMLFGLISSTKKT